MEIRIYLRYKLNQMKEGSISFGKMFMHPRTWIYVYGGLALGLVAANIIGGQYIPLLYLLYPFAFMVGIWIFLDYRSGRHMYWHKKANRMPTKGEIRRIKLKNPKLKDKEDGDAVEGTGAEAGQPNSDNGG